VTEAVGRSGSTRISLIDVPSHPQLAFYALWDDLRLARLAIVNAAPRQDDGAEAVSLDLSTYVYKGSSTRVKRMTAPSIGEKDTTKVTWAGQSYAQGIPTGTYAEETLQDGRLTLQGVEAVIVFL
jgi:hypothetical protein